jgi:glyoxylase-like metal-dependent hydrolase (beta-lactamase superfamily II)
MRRTRRLASAAAPAAPAGSATPFARRLPALIAAIAGLLTLALTAGPAAAQQPVPSPQSLSELVRLKDDVYAFRYQNHVSMFIPTDEGTVVVDPIGQSNPRAPAVLKEAIRSVTDRPVRWLLYSHWGADHGTGGIVFRDTATFLSHRNAAPKIAAANDPTSPVPDVTVDGGVTLEVGGKTLVLQHTALSPTDDYFLVWYPAQKVLMVVDQVRVKALAFGDLQGAPPERMAEHLQYLADNFDFDVLLWGHGAGPTLVGTRQDLLDHRQYYLDLMDAVRAARAAGHPDNSEAMLGAVRTALAPKYGTWQNFPGGLAANVSGVLRWASAAGG